MRALRGLRPPLLAAALLGGALAMLAACDGDTTVQDTRDIRQAYYDLRDALLQGNDEAFFALHGSEARRWAVESFPAVRAEYLTGSPEQRESFRRQYRVTEEEFLRGEPRDLVVKMMPWKSGWRDSRELFRTARVKDVSIDYVPLPGGGTERRGVVELEPPEGASAGPGAPYPTVIFIKEKEGWRRRSFFVEVLEVAPPKRPGG